MTVESGGYPTSGEGWRGEHAVQFYDNEAFLFEAVSNFLAGGLSAGHPAIVIATGEHCRAFANSLQAKGIDGANILYADARDTLARFMNGAMPDEAAFRLHVGGLIAETGNGGGLAVRAYGEMVDLLWRDGNSEGAIRLEELWNELIDAYSFSLLCAYPMGGFYKEAHRDGFERVCATHSIVVPAESRELSRLQQRAGALEAEIAHRKELESALRRALADRRQAERDLQDFFDHATVAMHWVGPDGTILWANDAELNLLGYTREEYIGRKIGEFHADAAVIDDIFTCLLNNEEVREREAQLVAKDGSIRYVEINSNSLFEDGEFKHTRCFTRDVTDRHRNQESNALLLEAASVLYRSLDYETRLRELGALLVPRVADWCAVDIAHDGAFERVAVCGETAHQPDDETIRAVIRNNEPHIVNDDGYSSMILPMRHPSGILGAVSYVANAPRPRYSYFDRTLGLELARRAAVAIENARLYRYAQQANRSKDEFLATLSHELRTPLTAILGWARMLRMGSVDPETNEVALETIERSARTQAALIDDILDLSRVVTGKMTLQSEPVDLAGVVANAIDTVRLAATAKQIQVELHHGSHAAAVIGDATRLQQIIWNLLANAIKFSQPGDTVHAELKLRGGVARVIVRDEGIGIRPEFLPHVFEPFLQGQAPTTRAYGGLGLGLAIVKYFTELHGGTVTAESRGEGHGSTFTVTLPLAPRRAAAAEERREVEADLRGTSIVVVDDDDDTRIVLTAALRSCGAEVRAAASVAQACRFVDEKAPDVLVTDIAMPQEDGFALLEYVRSGRARAIPAIALTALGAAKDEARVVAAGFNAFVRKPVEPLQFAAVVAGFKK